MGFQMRNLWFCFPHWLCSCSYATLLLQFGTGDLSSQDYTYGLFFFNPGSVSRVTKGLRMLRAFSFQYDRAHEATFISGGTKKKVPLIR